LTSEDLGSYEQQFDSKLNFDSGELGPKYAAMGV
jgi:hypothetical protein